MFYKSFKRALLASTSISKVHYRAPVKQAEPTASASTHHEFTANDLVVTPPTSGLD